MRESAIWGRIGSAAYAYLCCVLLLVTGCERWTQRPPVHVQKVNAADKGAAVVHYAADGGAAIGIDRQSDMMLCALPPAQGMRLLDQTLSGETTVNTPAGEAVSAKLSSEAIETLGKLYEQTDRSLFLQFALYRLCEAQANDTFNGTCDPFREKADAALKIYSDASDADKPALETKHNTALGDYQKCLDGCTKLDPVPQLEAYRAARKAAYDAAVAAAKSNTAADAAMLNGLQQTASEEKKLFDLMTNAHERCLGNLTADFQAQFVRVIQASKALHEIDERIAIQQARKARDDAAKAKLEAETTKANAAESQAVIQLDGLKTKALEKAFQEPGPSKNPGH